MAFTEGVGLNVLNEQTAPLQDALESLARLAELDSIVVTDLLGREVLGVLRVETPGLDVDYAVSTATDLSSEPLVQTILTTNDESASGLMRSPLGADAVQRGAALQQSADWRGAGRQQSAQRAGSSQGQCAGRCRALRRRWHAAANHVSQPCRAALAGACAGDFRAGVERSGAGGDAERTDRRSALSRSYQPFVYGDATIGVVAALLPDDTTFATEVGRQITALFASALTGAAVIVAFIGVARMSGRIERVTEVAKELATGNAVARTEMLAADEIGAMGRAPVQYAEYAQQQQDTLRSALRRQRRKPRIWFPCSNRWSDGVVVQDLSGRVLLMNEIARGLGSQRVLPVRVSMSWPPLSQSSLAHSFRPACMP
ncbi:MAG: hypothetical protein U0694_20270 [Anaerolineae bacterium]